MKTKNYIQSSINRAEGKQSADLYTTPSWAIESLLNREVFEGVVVDPCVGLGHISDVLKARHYETECYDLVDYGYSETTIRNFLDTGSYQNIITNPPYNVINEFTLKALQRTTKKVALLVRIGFLESTKRLEIFNRYKPNRIYAFSKRVQCLKDGLPSDNSSAVFYCWVVWDLEQPTDTTVFDWI